MKLKPYPEYKDSGVPWLGEIPKHWQALPNRALFAEVNDRNHPDEPLLSVTIGKGVIRQSELLANSSKKDSSNENKANYKLVQPRDIAYNKMRAWQGAVGVSNYRGIVSPAYIVVHPRGEQNPEYFHYLLRTPAFAKEAERWSYGITSDQWSLRAEDFKQIYCSLPPKEEQESIVRFLAHADHRINRLIRAKRRLIELLNEQKQVIIHRAVTRGLDPNVRLKPSGVEWLGEVPEHWEIRRNLRIFRERNERGRDDLPVLIVSLRTGVTIGEDVDEDGRPRRLIEDRSAYKFAAEGDIAYNMMRMWQGAVGVVPTNGLVSPAYIVARPLAGMDSRYFTLLFCTKAYKDEINRKSRGIVSDRNRLYWGEFKELVTPVPSPEDQRRILEHIANESARIDAAITRSQREIALLREYRTRLIADVVTGKLDVRGVIEAGNGPSSSSGPYPGLPDEVEELDDLDPGEDAEAEEIIDTEETTWNDR